jgi:hypothetical protein
LGAGVFNPRFAIILVAGVTAVGLSGCAYEQNPSQMSRLGLQPGAAQAAAVSGRPAPMEKSAVDKSASDIDADLKRASRQTISAKMLAAIALQRVTGRTPDPSRFSELR